MGSKIYIRINIAHQHILSLVTFANPQTFIKVKSGKLFKHMNLVIVLLFTLKIIRVVRLIEITQFKKTKGKIY